MFQPAPLERAPTADELIRGFHQGGAGNCASLAIIKAALMAFGTRPILAGVREDGSRDIVVFRDASAEYTIGPEEMDAARTYSHFQGTDTVLLAHANYLFAAMAKRAQVEGNDSRASMTFREAAETLNDGEHWLEGPRWLGLGAFVVNGGDSPIPWFSGARAFLKNQPAGIGKSRGHTWFASMGVHDHWGRPGKAPFLLSGAIALDAAAIARHP